MRHELRTFATDAVFRALVIPIARQARGTPHAHNLHELVVVRQGAALHQLGARDWPIAAGEVFVIPPGVPHAYRERRDLALINVLLHPPLAWLPLRKLGDEPGWQALFVDAPRDRPGGRLRLSPDELIETCRRCDRIRDEALRRQTGWRTVATAELAALLTLLVRWWPRRGVLASDPRITALCAHIDRHHQRPLPIGELAAAIAATPRTVQRLCREHLGGTPQQVIERVRLDHAAELLAADARLPIGQIARQVGFGDPSYFARRWRRRFGSAPRYSA